MKRVMQLLLLCAIVIGPVELAAGGNVRGPLFDALYVFGDSLSDTGNVWRLTGGVVPPSESPRRTYYHERFSNGPVAVEYFWLAVSGRNSHVRPFLADATVEPSAAVNFAFGGATTAQSTVVTPQLTVPGLLGQVELFGAANINSSAGRPLYFVFAGANDYLAASPSNPVSPVTVVANIRSAVERLHTFGARKIMVMNLPDLALVPIVPPEARPALSSLVSIHNSLLHVALESAEASLPGLDIIEVDVYRIVNALRRYFDFTTPAAKPDLAATCLFTDPMTCPDVHSFMVHPQYFFWDIQHPTTVGHLALGANFYARLLRE
jgi:outer membrane lipase/esterase